MDYIFLTLIIVNFLIALKSLKNNNLTLKKIADSNRYFNNHIVEQDFKEVGFYTRSLGVFKKENKVSFFKQTKPCGSSIY